jgi:hypothetical protein
VQHTWQQLRVDEQLVKRFLALRQKLLSWQLVLDAELRHAELRNSAASKSAASDRLNDRLAYDSCRR